jgi:ABC-2 type transport system ATP-binding protein
VSATTAPSTPPPGAPLRAAELRALPPEAAIEAVGVSRQFGRRLALDDVTLTVQPSQVHALLGPNGAGKTTLLRALTGLVAPDSGAVRIVGHDAARATRQTRALTGFVPSGDRTFYLRLSGLENLVFFARLQGIRRRQAVDRALEVLDLVGLTDAARQTVGAYSHGMQKRLSLGRALLTAPTALLVDEATHDLDPEASAGVRGIVEDLARRGAAVLWATQRIDEIRGFADQVTLLGAGRVRFAGSVPALMAHAEARHFVLRLDTPAGPLAHESLAAVLGRIGTLTAAGGEHWRLSLAGDSVLGEAVAALAGSGVSVVGCHRERSELEEAFMALSGGAV